MRQSVPTQLCRGRERDWMDEERAFHGLLHPEVIHIGADPLVQLMDVCLDDLNARTAGGHEPTHFLNAVCAFVSRQGRRVANRVARHR